MSFLLKNTASQRWKCFAFTRSTGEPLTGGAAAITAKIRKDYGSRTATNDTTPDELEDGYYEFLLTQAETNADIVELFPESATAGVQVIPIPATQRTLTPIAGRGADEVTLTIRDSSNNPIPDADAWITSDAAGSVVVAGTLRTNASGEATFLLDDGESYYLWMQRSGYNSIQGEQFTASAD
jgi:hypothetical protein